MILAPRPRAGQRTSGAARRRESPKRETRGERWRALDGVPRLLIDKLLERRAKVFAKLQERGMSGYYELLKALNRAQTEGVF